MQKKELNSFIKICNSLGARGWCPGSSGNASIIDPENGVVYIKESGKTMASFSLPDVVAIDMKGNVVKSEGKPSKEFRFHLGIYDTRKEVKAIIHTHSPFATAFAICNKEFPLRTAPGILVLRKVPVVDYYAPGSEELALKVKECFKDQNVRASLLRNHGVVATGKTIVDASNVAEWVEDAARESFLSSAIMKIM